MGKKTWEQLVFNLVLNAAFFYLVKRAAAAAAAKT